VLDIFGVFFDPGLFLGDFSALLVDFLLP